MVAQIVDLQEVLEPTKRFPYLPPEIIPSCRFASPCPLHHDWSNSKLAPASSNSYRSRGQHGTDW
jgi:hypothetical protein